ncbi:hypothetical protein [Pararhodobacter sp. SW119]|uniref:hypothetical protein n=1 Tax=Pararhodobacter sp. SW119 TaxID=2780075 RepID=UPI001AE01802|nr:hypothetical protein [Pararhodobacter sp. SW119]
MKLYYWKAPAGNVGDDLNPWLWPRVFGPDFLDEDAVTCLVGIGSVIDGHHRFFEAPCKIVFGSGVRRRSEPFGVDFASFNFRFVRGPRSARALAQFGVQTDWISDPAALTPLLLRPSPITGRERAAHGSASCLITARLGHWPRKSARPQG